MRRAVATRAFAPWLLVLLAALIHAASGAAAKAADGIPQNGGRDLLQRGWDRRYADEEPGRAYRAADVDAGRWDDSRDAGYDRSYEANMYDRRSQYADQEGAGAWDSSYSRDSYNRADGWAGRRWDGETTDPATTEGTKPEGEPKGKGPDPETILKEAAADKNLTEADAMKANLEILKAVEAARAEHKEEVATFNETLVTDQVLKNATKSGNADVGEDKDKDGMADMTPEELAEIKKAKAAGTLDDLVNKKFDVDGDGKADIPADVLKDFIAKLEKTDSKTLEEQVVDGTPGGGKGNSANGKGASEEPTTKDARWGYNDAYNTRDSEFAGSRRWADNDRAYETRDEADEWRRRGDSDRIEAYGRHFVGDRLDRGWRHDGARHGWRADSRDRGAGYDMQSYRDGYQSRDSALHAFQTAGQPRPAATCDISAKQCPEALCGLGIKMTAKGCIMDLLTPDGFPSLTDNSTGGKLGLDFADLIPRGFKDEVSGCINFPTLTGGIVKKLTMASPALNFILDTGLKLPAAFKVADAVAKACGNMPFPNDDDKWFMLGFPIITLEATFGICIAARPCASAGWQFMLGAATGGYLEVSGLKIKLLPASGPTPAVSIFLHSLAYFHNGGGKATASQPMWSPYESQTSNVMPRLGVVTGMTEKDRFSVPIHIYVKGGLSVMWELPPEASVVKVGLSATAMVGINLDPAGDGKGGSDHAVMVDLTVQPVVIVLNGKFKIDKFMEFAVTVYWRYINAQRFSFNLGFTLSIGLPRLLTELGGTAAAGAAVNNVVRSLVIARADLSVLIGVDVRPGNAPQWGVYLRGSVNFGIDPALVKFLKEDLKIVPADMSLSFSADGGILIKGTADATGVQIFLTQTVNGVTQASESQFSFCNSHDACGQGRHCFGLNFPLPVGVCTPKVGLGTACGFDEACKSPDDPVRAAGITTPRPGRCYFPTSLGFIPTTGKGLGRCSECNLLDSVAPSQCPPGKFCTFKDGDPTQMACKNKLANGQLCLTDNACASGYCMWNAFCAAGKVELFNCAGVDSLCGPTDNLGRQTGYCHGGITCVERRAAGGSPCLSDNVCRPGLRCYPTYWWIFRTGGTCNP